MNTANIGKAALAPPEGSLGSKHFQAEPRERTSAL